MSCILNCLNTTAYKTTSYKYGLLKAVLDNLYNCDNYRLSFDELLLTFAKIYWNIIVKYDLPQKQMSTQGNLSSMEIIIMISIKMNLIQKAKEAFVQKRKENPKYKWKNNKN